MLLLLVAGMTGVALKTGLIPWPGSNTAAGQAAKFHCPMHPTVVADRPGSCPICGMDLVPIGERAHASAGGPHSSVPGLAVVSISPEARQLMGLKLGAVEKRPLSREVRTSARIVADETRQWRVTTKVEGWVDQLFVAYTGQEVKKGDPLLTIYSPDLVTAQAEYLSALRSGGGPIAAAVRRRLELWDISEDQIARLERTGRVEKHLTLFAPASGVVMVRDVLAGQKLMPGEPLMVIADLSMVWGDADIYQSDLLYVKVGQPLELALPYWPDKVFEGKVIFVSPTLDAESRTLRARLEVPNPEGLLKPGMFGDARLNYDLGETLSLSVSAVMVGGRQTYAFRDLGDGHVVPAEIKIGRRSGGYYELLGGLNEGDKVVASANFLVDSESNLKAALEALAGGEPPVVPAQGELRAEEIPADQIGKVLPAYLEIQAALAGDNLGKAIAAAKALPDAKLNSLATIGRAEDIGQARTSFAVLSVGLRHALEKDGTRADPQLNWFYCPMAFDNLGAEWLQTGDEARNPYFGASMLECGDKKGSVATQASPPPAPGSFERK